MSNVTTNLQHWPIVQFEVVGKLALDGSQEIIRGMQQALERGQSFTTLTDLSKSVTNDKKDQESLVAFLQANRDGLRKHCRGAALVVNSHVTRLTINAFVLLVKLPFPTRAFTTAAEATAWCNAQLASKQAA